MSRWAEDLNAPAVLVRGDAGIGKTRVVLEFAALLQEQKGSKAFVGRCAALGEAAPPFAPFVEVLRELLPLSSGGVRREDRRILAHLLPELGPPGQRSRPQTSTGRGRLFAAVQALLSRAGAETGAVVVFEDVHWMTAPGLELLEFLVRSRLRGVGFVLTARDEGLMSTPLNRFVTYLEGDGLLDVLSLDVLTDDGVDALVGSVLGQAARHEVTRRIRKLSGGNPLLAEELAQHEARGGREKLPRGLAERLTQPALRLSEQVGSLLGAVAAAGESVTHQLLVAVSGLDPAELDEAAREAVQARLVELTADGRGYRFRHELVREACYDRLLPADRIRLHLSYATRLAAQVGQGGLADLAVLVRLAHHYDEAGEEEAAVRWALVAADAAEREFAYPVALSLYQRALTLWAAFPRLTGPFEQRRVDIYRRAARVADLVSDHAVALGLVEQALELVDPSVDPTFAGLLEGRRAWYRLLTLDTPVPTDCQSAVDLVPAQPPTPERARVLATHSRLLSLFGRAAEAVPVAEEALSLALSLEAEPERVAALSSLGLAKTLTGDAARGISLLEEACASATAAHVVDDLAPGYDLLLGAMLVHEPDLTRVGEIAAAAVETLTGLGIGDGHPRLHAAVADFELGNWAGAEGQARHVLSSGGPFARLFADLLLGLLAACRGTPGADVAQKWHPEVELPGHACRLYGEWLAEIQLLEGQPAAAAATVEAALSRLEGAPEVAFCGRLFTFGMRAQADLAVKGWDTSDRALVADAQAAAVRLIVRAQRVHPHPFQPEEAQVPTAAADAATWQGECSRVAGAPSPTAWAAAAEAWQQLSRHYRSAYSRWRQAEALLSDRHHQSDAVQVVRQALVAADLLGAVRLRRELDLLARGAGWQRGLSIAQELQESGAGPRAILTPREQEVLRLLAEGLSNRAIAAALVISPKTVDTHLTHVLTKLDVHTRLAAISRAQRLGMLR